VGGITRKIDFISDYKNPALSLQKIRRDEDGAPGGIRSGSGQTRAAARFKRGTAAAADRPSHSARKANAVIETKERWLEVQQSKLKLVGRRIALAVIFFIFRETIRFLD
jgi:hypothetical protein